MRRKIVGGTAFLALVLHISTGPAAGQSAQEIFRSSKCVLFDLGCDAEEQVKPAAAPVKPKKAPPPVQQAPVKQLHAAATPGKPASVPTPPATVVAGEPGRLAMRYRIEKDQGDGTWRAVDPDSVFRSGDRIRLAVESNARAYLYVINQGSSGRGKLIYPYQGAVAGSNAVDPFRTYIVPDPSAGVFRFDDQPGDEKLYVVLSGSREASLDRFLPERKDEKKPGSVAPSGQSDAAWRVARADSTVEPTVLSELRTELGASRDLIMERVEEPRAELAGSAAEVVSYIASRAEKEAARVIVEVTLSHR